MSGVVWCGNVGFLMIIPLSLFPISMYFSRGHPIPSNPIRCPPVVFPFLFEGTVSEPPCRSASCPSSEIFFYTTLKERKKGASWEAPTDCIRPRVPNSHSIWRGVLTLRFVRKLKKEEGSSDVAERTRLWNASSAYATSFSTTGAVALGLCRLSLVRTRVVNGACRFRTQKEERSLYPPLSLPPSPGDRFSSTSLDDMCGLW